MITLTILMDCLCKVEGNRHAIEQCYFAEQSGAKKMQNGQVGDQVD